MAKQFCLLVVSVVLNIGFCSLYWNEKWGGVSWTRKAAEEAEEIASIACSGHGRAFLDGVVVDGKNPVCECYACYTGPTCSLLSYPCIADADSGNPIFLEPYWMERKESSSVVVSGWHRLGYTYPEAGSGSSLMSSELEIYIRKLHELVGNAVTQGSHIVFGTGSTQLVNAAVHALATSSNTSTPAMVVASIPYYPIYESQTEMFQSSAYEFKGDTALWKKKTKTSNSTFIEFVTSPNNPDGKLREAILEGPTVKTIHDRVYYWPHYTAIPAPADDDLMLFSISKLSGHAGSRFGWALVKDKEIHRKMVDYVGHNTLGVSHDTQLRALKLLKKIVEDGGRDIFEYGHNVMHRRWQSLNFILSHSSRFSLQQIRPQFCNFYQRVRDASPAYAWVKCESEKNEDCYEVLKSAGIMGRKAEIFGAANHYVRLSLLKSQDDFDLLLHYLEAMVYGEIANQSYPKRI